MTAATPVEVSGIGPGAANVYRHEGRLWWRRARWWVQLLLWSILLGGLLLGFLWVSAEAESAGIELDASAAFPQYVGMAVLLSIVGTTVLTQGVMLDERRSGTLEWVLAKPVSRPALVVAKYAAHAAAVLVVLVLGPWAAVYAVLSSWSGRPWPPGELALVAGLVALLLLFTLALVLLLGTVSSSRALVVGAPIAAGLLYDIVHVVAPGLAGRAPVPWELTPLAIEAAAGEPLTSVVPIVATVIWTGAAVAVAAWRFSAEEIA